MTLLDMIELGFENLRRTKLRTILTTLGVVIGIGALTSMVSFGTGMQKNITEAFRESDLFTSIFVTSKDIEEMVEEEPHDMIDALRKLPSLLTDSTLYAIQQLPGVDIAFPEISFPVRIRIEGSETKTMLRALPARMKAYKPFSEPMYGEFFSDDTTRSVVIRWETLRKMGLLIEDAEHPASAASEDTLAAMTTVHPDSIIGSPVEIISAVLDPSRLAVDPMRALLQPRRTLFREAVSEFKICGILRRSSTFSRERFRGGVIVPMKAAQEIPRLGFSTVWELLGGDGKGGTYNSIYVRVKRMADMQNVRESIQQMGLHVFSISDELKEIKRGFLVVDSILGAIGTIALIVAALGIANTMVMSILERTREIGILKAIGGSEGEIKMIFFVEAATIGMIGAIFGLILGWAVTRVANIIVNAHLMPEGEPPVNLFYFPIWLILGAVAFSLVVSLVAGVYPATRAARVDPVTALRHD